MIYKIDTLAHLVILMTITVPMMMIAIKRATLLSSNSSSGSDGDSGSGDSGGGGVSGSGGAGGSYIGSRCRSGS